MEKLLYKGRLLSLYKRTVTLPNGYKADLEVVKHPGAALLVPFLTVNKIILLRQLRPVINSYIYELPAGTLNKGESPFLCARREIIEETGYSAKKFVRLGCIFPVPGYSTEKITIFKALGLKESIRQPEKDEIIKHVIVSRKQIRRLFKSGKIVDAKTIAALVLTGWL
jgi:ADP-ribose pyrophosphatase